MKTFRELLDGKVWKAVQAMIDGLRTQSQREDFEIYMSTFGKTYQKNAKTVCFGCAATCTIQQVTNVNLVVETIEMTSKRANALGVNIRDLDTFESAIDNLRKGVLRPIWYYMGDARIVPPSAELVYMMTNNWEIALASYQAYADQLKALDI